MDLNLNLDHEFGKIEENFISGAGREYAASRGEYLNGLVMSAYLGIEFIDAAEVIFFDDQGNLDADFTNQELSERLSHAERAVIPGFYGATTRGTSAPFPEAAPISPVLWWQRPFTPICMRTGPTYPAFWWRTPGL